MAEMGASLAGTAMDMREPCGGEAVMKQTRESRDAASRKDDDDAISSYSRSRSSSLRTRASVSEKSSAGIIFFS